MIGQFPNAPLRIFLAAALLQWLFKPAGAPGTGLTAVATGALIWWAVDELLRGVNPWRRTLGGVVLVGQVAKLLG